MTPILMPVPNRLRYRAGFVSLCPDDAVWSNEGARTVCPDLRGLCAQELGLDLRPTERPEGGVLRFQSDVAQAAERLERELPRGAAFPMGRPESYAVEMDERCITVNADDPRGFFNALQTLKQLSDGRRGNGSTRLLVKRASILDWPHCSLRAVHVYLPARENFGFFRRLVDGLAELKYNRLYVEVSGMEFRRHPEINRAWIEYARDMDEFPEKAKTYQSDWQSREHPWYKDSIHIENAGGGFLRQDEVRDLVAYCRSRFVEVVPEVQSLSHCDYLVIPHPEIAEIPDDPYPDSYCPSNPRSYELLFDVIDEVIEVFSPRTVHIGHDEWYTVGYCPACRARDAGELLAEDVRKIHDYLAGKGVRCEMWGDKLLDAHTPDGRGQGGAVRIVENYSTSEAFRRIAATHHAVALIPKDVGVGHWFWSFEPGGFERLARHGIREAFCSNFYGPNLKDWERFSRMDIVKGGFLSHWDLLERDNMAREGTLTNIVYSAYPLWCSDYDNGSWPRVRDLTVDAMPRFMETLDSRARPSSLPGRRAASALVRHEERDRFYMDASTVELRAYEGSTISVAPAGGTAKSARVTAVPIAQSYRVAVLHDRADSLVFRHTTTISLPWRSADHGYRHADYRIGFYTVAYQDGTTAAIDLMYGSTIGNVRARWRRSDNGSSYQSDVHFLQMLCDTKPWLKVLDSGEVVTVYDFEWLNPAPDRIVSDIRLTLVPKSVPFSVFVYDIQGMRVSE